MATLEEYALMSAAANDDRSTGLPGIPEKAARGD
jgi:hypothetical protein